MNRPQLAMAASKSQISILLRFFSLLPGGRTHPAPSSAPCLRAPGPSPTRPRSRQAAHRVDVPSIGVRRRVGSDELLDAVGAPNTKKRHQERSWCALLYPAGAQRFRSKRPCHDSPTPVKGGVITEPEGKQKASLRPPIPFGASANRRWTSNSCASRTATPRPCRRPAPI
jgi:hypothetical protein